MTDFPALRQAMVDCQVRPSDVTRYAIIDAMLWAPREQFVPKSRREIAYSETEIALGDGRVVLAPRTFAKMLEAVAPGSDDLVLDLAPGAGYSTAVLSRLSAAVVAIEPDEALVAQTSDALVANEVDNAVVAVGDPAEGDPAHGPYDVIFIGGGVETLPEALTTQLKDGGRLVAIFMEGSIGQCRVMVRAGDNLATRYAFDATAPVLPGFTAEDVFAF